MNDGTTYVRDGYEDGAMRIIEKRGGKPVHVWRGYFNGGNHVNMRPAHPWNGVWDGRERRQMILSVFEIKRAD
jgi:hypothetical protein